MSQGASTGAQVGSAEDGSPQFCIAEIGLDEISSAEVGGAQVGSAEGGSEEVGGAQVGYEEIGSPEDGLAEVSSPEVSSPEVGSQEVGSPQFGIAEIGLAEGGTDEAGFFEVWFYIWMLFPPVVPRHHSLFEHIKMLPVCHGVFSSSLSILGHLTSVFDPNWGGVSYMLRFLLCACGTLAPFPPTDTKGGQNSPPSDYRQAHQRTAYAAKADGLMSQSTRWRPRRFLVSRGSRWLPFCGDHQPYHCAFACLFHEGLPRLNAFLDGDLASEGWIAQLLPPFDSALLPHVACLYVG